MAIKHIGIIISNKNMYEQKFSQLPSTLPSHLSIPLGLTLPEIYDELSINIQTDESDLDENLLEINTVEMKKMDHLFQQISIETRDTSKSKEITTRKTRKIHKK